MQVFLWATFMAAGKFLLGLLLWQQVSFCWSYFYGSRQVFVGATFMAAGMLGIGHYGGGRCGGGHYGGGRYGGRRYGRDLQFRVDATAEPPDTHK